MTRPLLLPCTLFAAALLGTYSASAKTDPGTETAPITTGDSSPDAASMPDQIRSELTADGYKEITVVPTSYAVSAVDKDGKRVLLLVGPSSMTKLPQEEPSTAQSPDTTSSKQMQQ